MCDHHACAKEAVAVIGFVEQRDETLQVVLLPFPICPVCSCDSRSFLHYYD